MAKKSIQQQWYLLMPDSFKGTMDAIEVCRIMKETILLHDQEAQVISVPIADGGEGTVDCFLHAFGGEKYLHRVTGPYGKPVDAFYGRMGKTAVIEMAAASGFSLSDINDPSIATTFGVGQLIKNAVQGGCRKIILGLGGSCTNDGGAGMASALGVKFYNQYGIPFMPAGKSLHQINRINTSACDQLLQDVKIEAMCDIDNPLYGLNGAAQVFAPQKGADADMVMVLDYNLECYADRIKKNMGINVGNLAGGGAAGGMGAGAYAFLKADLKQGINVILDLMKFETLLKDCKVIFTGEGKLDKQSLGGKAVIGIARRAKKAKVPVIAVVGTIEGDISPIYELGVTAVYRTDPGTYKSEEQLIRRCKKDLVKTMKKILHKKI